LEASAFPRKCTWRGHDSQSRVDRWVCGPLEFRSSPKNSEIVGIDPG
jgi:hypothetical protein